MDIVVNQGDSNVVVSPTASNVVLSGFLQGIPGVAGASGGAWLFVAGIPSNILGQDGQTAYSTDTGGVYNKVAGAWVLQGTIAGQQLQEQELIVPVVANGAMAVALPNVDAALGVDAFINGIKQSRSEFTATNTALTLPTELNLIAGDTVSVLYRI